MQRDEKRAPQKHLHARLVMGMSEGIFFSFEIFNSGIFLGRKILANIFLGGLI